ncbi:MAG: hypothetical protein L0Y79_02050 [Chlorobi bacterium]|nr:hypothetical protein [Chlorobiota bacterium]MCI0714828.1 hypothetical protein [Chlorobiota bacterium]
MKNTICWFEIPVYNFDQAESFYNHIFGIELHRGESNGCLMGVFTGGDDEGVHGAIVKGEGYIPCDHGPLIYLNGGYDLNTVLSKVEEAGGSIILQKTFVSESVGYVAMFYDTEGNRIGLYSGK